LLGFAALNVNPRGLTPFSLTLPWR